MALGSLCPAGAVPAKPFAERNVHVNRNRLFGTQILQGGSREIRRDAVVEFHCSRVARIPWRVAGIHSQFFEDSVGRHVKELVPQTRLNLDLCQVCRFTV